MNSRSLVATVAMGTTLACLTGAAQVAPRFDIAEVRTSPAIALAPVNPATQGGVVRDGLYRIQSATMLDLIRTAYGIEADAIVGGPSWLEWDRFDIVARVPPSTSVEMARPMLQELLAERFALALHKDSRPLPGYALKAGRAASSRLKPADGSGRTGCTSTALHTESELNARRQAAIQAGEKPVILQTYVHACRNTTMKAFAEGLRGIPGAQQYVPTGAVLDQTNLSGEWDFEFRYTPGPLGSVALSGASAQEGSFAAALDRELGLRLEAVKIPTAVMVVDRVNRTPGDNPPGVTAILAPSPPSAFEVAALRLSDPNAPDVRSSGPMPGGRFEVQNFSLKQLITLAWGIAGSELRGEPAWLNSARVDLSARLPSTESTREIAGVMDMNAFLPAIRTLLTERFKLAIRTEQQPGSGYALVAAKPRLQKADPATRTKCVEGPGANGKDPRVSNALLSRLVTCRNMTMQQFAEQIPRLSRGSIRGEVLDATGVKGAYDLTLSFGGPGASPTLSPAPMPAAAAQPAAPDPSGALTLFDALERQLGLRLEKRTVPVQVNVLDHIEAKPTDN